MILANTAPVVVASTAKSNPNPALTDARISSLGSRRRRYITEVTQDTRKASTATHAIGTWKNTMREDSPMKPWAG